MQCNNIIKLQKTDHKCNRKILGMTFKKKIKTKKVPSKHPKIVFSKNAKYHERRSEMKKIKNRL